MGIVFESTMGFRYRMRFGYKVDQRQQRITTCVLDLQTSTGKWEGTAFRGEAKAHKNDRFVKETGRKLALARALANMDRDTRSRAWASYRQRTMVSTRSQMGVVLH